MGKYCVIHISATRGAIDTKFAGYIHPVLPQIFSAFGVARSRRVPAAGIFQIGQGVSTRWPKNTIIYTFLTISGVYFLVSQKRHRISAHKQYQNKGGYLPCAAVPLYRRIFPQLSTGWVKASLVQFCNLNFLDNFWSLLPYISETTDNLGTQ